MSMSLENLPEIPKQIESIMESGELGNMRNLCGWAVGHAVQVDAQGEAVARYENAWVELFNGKGRAGEFGGVRFMAVEDGEYEEAYAYPDADSAEGNYPCYYITEWVVPDHADVGMKYPNAPGVDRL